MDFLDALKSLVGSAVAVAGTIAVVIAGRLILRQAVKDKRTLPYYGQFYTLLLSLVGLFIAIALLPLPSNIRAQMLSVFGILLSAVIALSATNLVGNAMAGIMLRLMKSFRPGDFIRFDDWVGRVTDIGLLHTEMQLLTRDIVAVPNSLLAQRAVRVTRRAGTFITATVTIGYPEPHGKVEEALKEAASACKLKEPFVFVEELLDYAVRYQLYGLLEEPSEMISRRSALLQSVLDTLHERGIEIMSPSIVDRREHGADYRFIPSTSSGKPADTPVEEQGEIESIAFDRAEQAESIESLYAEQEKLNHALEELEKGKGEEGEQAKERRSEIKAKLKEIADEIEKRESEKEEQKLEEEAPE
ncbi:mechanosensitive ion channel family protein [Salinispira pacifica]